MHENCQSRLVSNAAVEYPVYSCRMKNGVIRSLQFYRIFGELYDISCIQGNSSAGKAAWTNTLSFRLIKDNLISILLQATLHNRH